MGIAAPRFKLKTTPTEGAGNGHKNKQSMKYNQTRVNGLPMPLLMGCTRPNKIQSAENEPMLVYDYMKQIVDYNLRTVGTRSLKVSITRKRNPSNPKGFIGVRDEKNEIDDQKIL